MLIWKKSIGLIIRMAKAKNMKNIRCFNHENSFHMVLGSNTELPKFLNSDWKELNMNEFPAKSGGSGVEGPVIAPPNLVKDSGFKRPPKKQKRPTNLHGTKNEWECEICDGKFFSSSNLKRHVESVHEKKKPFSCEICSKKFGSKYNLNQHIAGTHEKKRPFKCSTCNKGFSRNFGRNRHQKSCKIK